MKLGAGSAASILVPQDLGEADDEKGRRKQNRPEELRSGTLFGQYQLRGSILVIKDNQSSVSGFIAFGTDMTTIPTTSASGSGVYIDYSGVYGLNSGTKQFYLQASDGKAYAGAGAVTLDANGIAIVAPAVIGAPNSVKWVFGGNTIAQVYGLASGIAVLEGTGAGSTARVHLVDGGVTNQMAVASNYAYFANDNNTFAGLMVAQNNAGVSPSSLLHLKSPAPTFRMEDATTSAKSLLVTVDANLATFEEVGGTDILVLNLANARVGIGAAPGASVLSITGLPTSAAGLSTGDVWNNGGILTIV